MSRSSGVRIQFHRKNPETGVVSSKFLFDGHVLKLQDLQTRESVLEHGCVLESEIHRLVGMKVRDGVFIKPEQFIHWSWVQ